MSERDPALCRLFVKEAKEILAAHPQIEHEWSIDDDEDHCILNIPKAAPEGFDITIEVEPHHIIVYGEGHHEHFDFEDNSFKVTSALGLVRDMLSPDMRIKEHLAGGSPYRWDTESLRDGQWVTEHTTGLFFWNYFGKRTYRIYQNSVLPGRLGKE